MRYGFWTYRRTIAQGQPIPRISLKCRRGDVHGVRREHGAQRVNASGDTLQTIVGMAKQLSEHIAEIAEASRQQSAGIEQTERLGTGDQSARQHPRQDNN